MRATRLGVTGLTIGVLAALLVPSTAPAAPPAQGLCSRPAVADIRYADGQISCLGVEATLSRAPAVGETAVLAIAVSAERDRDDVQTEVELPPNLVWEKRVGIERRSIAAGASARSSGVVRAVRPGPAQIQVRAKVPGDTASDDVFLTVAPAGGRSAYGIKAEPRGAAGAAAGPATPDPRVTRSDPVRLAPRHTPAARKTARLGPEVASCVNGRWLFQEFFSGAWRAAQNVAVYVWDRDVFDGQPDLLTFGLTDVGGFYNFCFDNDDVDGGLGDNGQDVYLEFVLENVDFVVRDNADNPYLWASPIVGNLADGANHPYGDLSPGSNMLAAEAYDAGSDAWMFIPGDCWDDNDAAAACRQVAIQWEPASVDGTYYSLADNEVRLAAGDPKSQIVVVHEIGHAVMDDAYEDAFPPSPSCQNHNFPNSTSPGCAWTEGFATWFALAVYNTPVYRYQNNQTFNLETPTWGSGNMPLTGDTVEGRVIGALWDLNDNTLAEGPATPGWDRFSEAKPGNIWTVFLNNVSNTFQQFWLQRGAAGFNVSSSALAVLYQNTIDYGFRDPLGNLSEKTRPVPRPHNYRYDSTAGFWSVVAVRPPAGANYNLNLYDDPAQNTLLASSVFAGTVVDFVAVNSNLRPAGDYYPRVLLSSGTGSYQIEQHLGANLPAATTQTIVFGTSDVVQVRDVQLTAGVPVTFTATPGNGTQDLDLFLMSSTAGVPSTFIRPRSIAAASSAVTAPGAAASFTFNPPASGDYGLVVVNKSGSCANCTIERT